MSPRFYEKKLETLIGHKIDYREQISATEGVLGIQMQESPGFTPWIEGSFLEFVPVKNTEDRCLINEIQKNKEYYICISSFNGLYAYNMGDIIKFISEDPPLSFSHREKELLIWSMKNYHTRIFYTQLIMSIKSSILY